MAMGLGFPRGWGLCVSSREGPRKGQDLEGGQMGAASCISHERPADCSMHSGADTERPGPDVGKQSAETPPTPPRAGSLLGPGLPPSI